MTWIRPSIAVMCAGCWVSGAEISDKIDRVAPDDTEDTDTPGPLEILSIDPAFGTMAGGTVVTVRAAPLGSEAEVRFDGVPGTVISVSGGSVVVTSPPGDEGPATVEVVSGAKSGRSGGAYRYWEDGTGKFGAIGAVNHYEYEGEYAQWIELETYDFAWVDLIRPAPYGYDGLFGTALDTCHSAWSYPGGTESYDTGASEVVLARAASTYPLPWNSDSDQFEAELPADAFAPYATYDLETIVGTAPWPAFGLQGIARTPGPFTVINPNIYFGSPFITATPRLQWTSNNPGDFMVARLIRWSGGYVAEEVRCLMRDDGDFTVPAGVWNGIAPLQYIDIFLGRVLTSKVTLPHNDAQSGVAGVYWVVGSTLVLQ